MSKALYPSDVQDVLNVLRAVKFSAANWRPLGRLLVPDIDLDAIEANHATVERSLEEVVSGWQRNGVNTWEKLIDAVSQLKDEGGGRNVAQNIRRIIGLAGDHDLPRQGSGDSAIGSEGIYSPTSPQPPGRLFSSRLSASDEMLSEEEVNDAVSKLNTCFNEMVLDTQDALQDSGADPRRIVNIIRLPDARFSNTPNRAFFDSLRVAADILDLFAELGGYWDHFNYYLLEQLILTRPAERLFAKGFKQEYSNLRERMIQYKEDMDYFRRHTSVEVYSRAVIQPKQLIPEGFKEMIEKRDDLKTLHDVEQFRQEVAHEYRLFECLVFLKYMEPGSVIVTLWIPASAEPIGALREVFHAEDDDQGSSVDPPQFTREPQVETTLPPDVETPHQGGSDKDKSQAVAKKESMAFSVITAVSQLVVPNMINPIVLMRAVSNGDIAKVEELLSHGADPNAFPIMIQFTPLMEASRLGNVEIAQLLLERGADPNLTNNHNWTALMAAANNGRLGTVDILLQKGANPDMRDHTGWSALMAAVYKDYHGVALRIIEAGATPHIQDHNHTNALLLAVAKHQDEIVVDALLDREPELDLQDSYGETALIFACKRKNLKFVKRLLSMGANPNIGNNDRETPVLIATGLGEKEILEELLEKYADPNKGKGPPLLVASDLGYEDIADLLMEHGADPDKEDERGVTAFEVAELRNFKDLANKLNPEQFSSRTPRDVYKLTKKSLASLASLQSHINRGPLFLNPDTKTGATGLAWLSGMWQRLQVH